ADSDRRRQILAGWRRSVWLVPQQPGYTLPSRCVRVPAASAAAGRAPSISALVAERYLNHAAVDHWIRVLGAQEQWHYLCSLDGVVVTARAGIVDRTSHAAFVGRAGARRHGLQATAGSPRRH